MCPGNLTSTYHLWTHLLPTGDGLLTVMGFRLFGENITGTTEFRKQNFYGCLILETICRIRKFINDYILPVNLRSFSFKIFSTKLC